MKIGSKIALFYTGITICMLTCIMVVFYFFIYNYINRLYDFYLADKAYLTAQKHWEKDEVDESSYEIIRQEYEGLLPQAKEILLNTDSMETVKDTLDKYLNKEQQKRLFMEEPVSFRYKKEVGAALYYPDNEGNFIVLILARNNYGTEIQNHVLILILLLFIFSSISVYFIGRFYANRMLAPVKRILKELRRIRGNNLNIRIKTAGNHDELDDLITSINGMLDRIDAAFKSEKSFVSSASHELNNPLTAIQGECEISLLKERSPQEYIKALNRISDESKRISLLIKSLLFLSHQDEELLKNNMEDVDLAELLIILCAENERMQFSNTFQKESLPVVRANLHLLKIAIRNILNNACKYSGEQPVAVRLYPKEGSTILEIEDKGIGIPEDEIQLIFQAFYRATNTREYSGHGIGLGLSLKILSIYGARMEILSKLNTYTRVLITFK